MAKHRRMANVTKNPIDVLNTVFGLKFMDLSREGAYALIVLVLSVYIFSLVCNLLLIGTIASNRSLHEPMYILLCNLSVSDIMGISSLVPRTIFDLMFEYGLTSLPACIIQAWFLHFCAGFTVLILSLMAFDRYVAICHPLRYHTIMSKRTLIFLIASCWVIVFVLEGILFGLTLQYPFCRTEIATYYCDNVNILKLTCATDTTVNNIYGLFITGFFHAVGLSSIAFSYTSILVICCKNNDSESKAKAWHTCGTHLTVFVIFEISCSAPVLAHRFPNSPPILSKITTLAYMIVPNSLNPLIYGLQTKDIKSKLKLLKNTIFGLKLMKIEHLKTMS